MKKNTKRLLYAIATGICTGLLNGLFGAGGGMVAVPALQKGGLHTKESHATSIAIIMPLCIASAILYSLRGNLQVGDALPYIPGGLAGALVGAVCLKKLKSIWIHRLFGVLILAAAWRVFVG